MEPNRREFIKQCAFQKFCNTVLHNEACDAHKELHRHKAKVTYLVCSSASERATDTLDKKIKKLIRKDMELNPANARK